MLTEEEHTTLIEALQELQGRITMRSAPSTALYTAIRVLEDNRARIKELKAKTQVVHPPPDSLY